ncbi:MAG TPA: hypothetical protein VGC47_03225 [Acidimicrobiia bacterium]|jgi:hypothetical protein
MTRDNIANGKSKREALRILKRRLTDVTYRTMINDTHTAQAAQPVAA